MGHCFRVTPSTAVPLDHQQTFCLSSNHTHCPVYCQTQPAPPPAAVGKQAVRFVWLLPTAVFLLLGLGAFVFWQQTPAAAPLPTPAVVAVMAETAVFTPTPTPTTQPATTTAMPLPTETVVALATVLPSATTPPTATSQPLPTETAVSTLETAASEAPAPPAVVVNVERLNVRSGPSTGYPILLVAEAGATFTAVGSVSARDWWQVCCIEGELAWVVAEAVTFVGDETAVSPASNIPPVPTAEP